MYNLMLGLPFSIESENISSYYDTKIRRLFIHTRVVRAKEEAAEPEDEEVEEVEEPVKEVESTREDKQQPFVTIIGEPKAQEI